MAYLREQTKEVDIDFPLDSVWKAIHKAVDEFDWEILGQDVATHQITIKTADTLTSYGSTLKVNLKHNQNATHMLVSGETPVTTITSTLQFGQTFDCIEDFVLALADIMNR
ncbi:MAG: hypothetical protein NWE93_03910 [Candidatus Bathyarchaeota archaeon]|nr:hypothetical protein [Candidatus Bathyarchaeota archaeon]